MYIYIYIHTHIYVCICMHSQYLPSSDSLSLCRKLSLHVDCFVFPSASSLVFLGAVNLNAMSRLAPTFIV